VNVGGYQPIPRLRGLRWLLWQLAAPARWYVNSFPIQRGKGLVLRSILVPLLPKHEEFDVALPTGARISLGYREIIGRRLILQGYFENAEIAAAKSFVAPGSTAIDVGANVGLFTLILSSYVGAEGHVIAVEPLPDNHRRLRRHLARNEVVNVFVEEVAVGCAEGEAEIRTDTDPALATAKPLRDASAAGAIVVPMSSLDTIWTRAGCPLVSYIKLDVEGNEAAALTGAARLITQCRPIIMAEANTSERLLELEAVIHPFGYATTQMPGFEPWNFVFQPRPTQLADN
jgi:FkbM family methyltransferase